MQETARQTAILRGIAQVLNRSFTLREALDGALRQLVDLMDVRSAWIFLVDPETGQFRLAADVNLSPALAAAGKRRMTGECRCITMMRDGELPEPINLIQCLRLEQAHPGDVSDSHRHASVPLVSMDHAVGILNVVVPPGRTLNDDDLDLLESIGHELAIAIQRARLFDQVRAQEHTRRELLQRLLVTQEEQQRRIAQELHDHAGQTITALIIQLAQLATKTASLDVALSATLERLHSMAQQSLDELRKLVYELRPTILDDLGLLPAVRSYVDTYVRPSGVDVDLVAPDRQERLPQDVETVAFRIIQEASTNALRHANARKLEIRVDIKGDLLLVMVRDNGVGFDAEQEDVGRHSLGLYGMRERAQLVGGTLQVLSMPGAGTTVLARLPVHRSGGDS
jgi:signal transduction histidine kinase